ADPPEAVGGARRVADPVRAMMDGMAAGRARRLVRSGGARRAVLLRRRLPVLGRRCARLVLPGRAVARLGPGFLPDLLRSLPPGFLLGLLGSLLLRLPGAPIALLVPVRIDPDLVIAFEHLANAVRPTGRRRRWIARRRCAAAG